MPNKINYYVIGDVQGCYDDLRNLLDKIKFDSKYDKLIFCGDIINRGPKSLETLRFIKKLSIKKSATMILGNHDLSLLYYAYGFGSPKSKDTISNILNAPDKLELIEWLRHRKILKKKENNIIVHAGIPPIWSFNKAKRLAKEVEEILKSDNLSYLYLKNMFGDLPNIWNDNIDGFPRFRIICNYFTRMRFCTNDGLLNFTQKSNFNNLDTEYKAWFLHKNHKIIKEQNDNIIFGHWASLKGYTGFKNIIATDYGCVWGGYLMAYNLKNKKKYLVKALNY